MKNRIDPNDALLEYTVFDGRTIETTKITRADSEKLDPQVVDYCIFSPLGLWGYRTDDGRWVQHTRQWPGLGDLCLRIVKAVQLNPDIFLSPADIAFLTGRRSLSIPSNLSARLLAIRKAHGETCDKPNFFLSKRTDGFGIAWNAQRTWMWLETLPMPSSQQDTRQQPQTKKGPSQCESGQK
jgi:hypothetical protein